MFDERGSHLKKVGPSTPISLLGLNSLVKAALNKAEAHKAIRDRVSAKVEANSSSKAALMQHLYNFILCNDGEKTINL